MAGININDMRNSNTTLVKVKYKESKNDETVIVTIQIQHLLKLNKYRNCKYYTK